MMCPENSRRCSLTILTSAKRLYLTYGPRLAPGKIHEVIMLAVMLAKK